MDKLNANAGRNEIIHQLKPKDSQMQGLPKVTAETLVNSSMEKVWKCWTEPQHIKRWNNISEDWHTPKAENDVRIGGKLFF